MKDLMIVFGILLVTLMLISAFGGGLRLAEPFANEHEEKFEEAVRPHEGFEEQHHEGFKSQHHERHEDKHRERHEGFEEQPHEGFEEKPHEGFEEQHDAFANYEQFEDKEPEHYSGAPQDPTKVHENFTVEPFQGCAYAACS